MLDFRVETFLAVCQTMNFTRAAEQLHITQPAVSQHIHALEEQYGTKLFRSQGKQLQLTESGRLFFRTAAAMHHDDLRLREALHQENTRRRLRFGATLTIGEYIMPGPLRRLLERKPDIQLYMLTANTQELLKLLDQGELDFAIVEGYFDKQAYDSLVYCTQRYIPVCSAEHPFSHPCPPAGGPAGGAAAGAGAGLGHPECAGAGAGGPEPERPKFPARHGAGQSEPSSSPWSVPGWGSPFSTSLWYSKS